MHKYTQNQSYVGSSGQTPTTNVSMTLCDWQILLPSAVHLEERLTVSQAVPEPGQQSVRQKHTVWVFCQWQTRPQAMGTLLS